MILTDFVEFRFYDASRQPDERNPDEGLLLNLKHGDYLSSLEKLWEFSNSIVPAFSWCHSISRLAFQSQILLTSAKCRVARAPSNNPPCRLRIRIPIPPGGTKVRSVCVPTSPPGTNGTSAHSRISSACGSPYGFQASSGTARIAPWRASLMRALIPQSGMNLWDRPPAFVARRIPSVVVRFHRPGQRCEPRAMHLSLPLFPCYLFLRAMKERRLEVLTMPGIVSVLGINGEPAAIPESEIESVRRVIEWGNRVEPHPFLRCGDRVRVISGPLQGLEGILVRKKSFYGLVLSIEMLERSAAVEVDVSAVERVGNRPPKLPWGPEPGINVGSVGRASRP